MEDNKLIELSVIIPTYNRKDALKNCIFSLVNQDYPRERYEIIIVDDGSYDGTSKMAEALLQEYPNIVYMYMPHRGPAATRNTGIEFSRGKIIALTDNDCIPASNWVRSILETHNFHKDVLAIGGLTEVDPHNTKAAVSQFLSDGAMSAQINNRLERIFFPTCNVSFKKEYLKQRFNELFPLPAGEDLEFFWRIFKAGNKLFYNESIRVFHNCHPDFKSFLKQAYKYGKGNFFVQHLHQDHPLLKEIKVRGVGRFIISSAINFLKIPRFSYLLGNRLICSRHQYNNYEKFQVYIYFALHKIIYLIGNITEYTRLRLKSADPEERKSKLQKKPEFIILDITHKCNLRCNICEIRKDNQVRELSFEEVKKLIWQANQWGVGEFVFSGGEPLLREDIFEVLDFVKANNYRVGLLTNGILLKDLMPRLSQYLVSNTLSLSISLDALSAEIHDDIRGKSGSFTATSEALMQLSEMKKGSPNINFNVISIVLNANLEELLPLAVFLKSLDVNSIQFQPLLANNLIMKERSRCVKYWIPPERLSVLDITIDSLLEFKKANLSLVRNSFNNLSLIKKYFRGALANNDVKCSYALKTMLIANNGDVTTCFDCYGNVRNNSLQEIFNSRSAEYSRLKVGECKSPCLLPCFTDWQE
jgi:MoaA/NifB/PqqE/SkfB family radical SAM enzyme/GT2 family glycosyltransferase